MALLSVDNLSVTLNTVRGPARAVRNLSFELEKGETLGIVGESGCGKSLTALAIMGLLPENGWADGRVGLDGENLLDYSEDQMCRVRGDRIGMVFQEPMTSLNPLHTVGKQIAEAMILHRGMNRGEARAEVIRLMDLVGIPEPAKRVGSYPHQLSGGQRQRVMIAMALSCGPELLIADEPTTALDVTIQKQILDLIKNLIEDLGMAMILISHNLGVISQNVKDVIVMYGGTRVESGPTHDVFSDLSHPYSQGLFSAVPQIDDTKASRRRLTTIPGTVPELADLPAGCTFQERCIYVTDACRPTPPPVVQVADGHNVACLQIEAARAAWAAR
jgi:peptide/nickel transport system ATP-binding protein